jgi:type IX secretion system PorP/SprF family membrane protein
MNIKAKPGTDFGQLPAIVRHTLRKTTHIWIMMILFISSLTAQDIHFSQFYNAPSILSPGLTGIFNGDTRITGLYRNQWRSVPVDYMTFSGAVDKKFAGRNIAEGFFAGGLSFNYDQAGLSKLRLINFNLSGSYTKKFSEGVFATLGAQVGLGQRSFKTDALTFDNQYDPLREWYDPALPTGEDFSNTGNLYIDFSAGYNLRFQALNDNALVDRLTKRSKLDIGIGVFHLNKPDQSFLDSPKSPLSIRLSPYALGTLQLGNSVDLIANFSAQFQKPYREYVGLLGGKIHINRQLGRQVALQLGIGYRFNNEFGDAYYPAAELQFNSLKVAFSYDINISEFDVATQRRGGPEISVQYIIKKVKPLPAFKICPLI